MWFVDYLARFFSTPRSPPNNLQVRRLSVTNRSRQNPQSPVLRVKSGRVIRSTHLSKHGTGRYKGSLLSTNDDPLGRHHGNVALDDEDNMVDCEAMKSKEERFLAKKSSYGDRKEKIMAPSDYLSGYGDDEDLPPLLPEEKAEFLPDLGKERDLRQSQLEMVVDPTWTQSEMYFYQKLTFRGFEPLVPNTWRLDFKTFPEELFSKDMAQVFFTAESGRINQATKALNGLINLGVRVRDRLLVKRTPEPTIRREIDNYIKWSHKDGDLIRRNFIPALVVETKSLKESVASVVDRMTTKLHDLGHRYRELYWARSKALSTNGFQKGKSRTKTAHPVAAEPSYDLIRPTLYGLIIAETVVSFITYDASVPDKDIRVLENFNFGDSSQDVWNGLAVGILVVLVRDFLMAQEAEIMDVKEESDPDA